MVISLFRNAAVAGVVAVGLAALPVQTAFAVNADHGNQIVSTNPADVTPHVMNGSVNAVVQIGNKIVAAGSFTRVRQTLNGPDITRNRIFAFDATTGLIDPTFDPNLNGAVNSLDTDGSDVFVGGAFTAVGSNTAVKRVAKLTASGALAAGQPKAPNKAVKEVVVRGDRLYVGGAFTNVGGAATPRAALAALDKNTGLVLPSLNLPFAGTFNGGVTGITRFDMSPAGDQLVAVGNFLTVDTLPREQIVRIDTPATGQATVSNWSTDRYDRAHNSCASVFDTWMRDVDFSPGGDFFAVTTTGAFAGGAGSGTLCDTTTRWESDRSGPGQQPTWVDYTGGDTTYGVAVTGSAIYVGGHMRWENNPYQGDQAGPGAVPREGIAALDPVNGLPLSWNPGRARGVGAQALYATSAGLWVGSDTTAIGKPRETHSRIAFMPLAGGTTVPTVNASTLPNELFLAQRASGTTNVLYRVNAAGPPQQSADTGPDWSTDSGLVSGGNQADWGSTVPTDGTVPPGTAPGIFATERWGEMHWAFPVTAGQQVTVRLYFDNQYGGTSQVGQRVFDVNIEGGPLELDDFDIVAATGDKRGTMRSFPVTSDGEIDIDFGAVVENPLVNGIEIIDPAVVPTSGSGALLRRAVDASGSPTSAAVTANSTLDWSTVRGAFLVNGKLYYGLGDGRIYARTFNTTTGSVGAAQAVNMYDDPDTGERIPFAVADMTGIFYDTATHRIYYTVFNDSRLFYRYFTPESEVIGAMTFTADSNGVDFSRVAGMTAAGGRILYGSSDDGALRSVPFSAGSVSGGSTVVDNDGTWRYRAMFVPSV